MKLPVYNRTDVQSLGRESVSGPIRVAQAQAQALGTVSRQAMLYSAEDRRRREEAEAEAKREQEAADRVTAVKESTATGIQFDSDLRDMMKQGGPDLQKNAEQLFTDYETETLNRVPDSQKQAASIALARQKQRVMTQIAEYQAKAAHAGQVSDIADTVSDAGNAILSNHLDYEQLREKALTAIDVANLSDEAKASARAKAESTMAVTYLEGAINEDPDKALAELKSGKLDSRMSPSQKTAAMRRAQAAIDRAKAEAERAQKEAQREAEAERKRTAREVKADVDQSIASIETTGEGMAGLDERAAESLTTEEWNDYKKAEKDAQDFHTALTTIQSTGREDMAETLRQMAPEPGTDDFVEDSRRYARLVDAAQTEMKLRAEMPADAAIRAPGVREAATDMQDILLSDAPIATKQAAVAEYIAETKGEQLRLGVPETRVEYLTDEMRGRLVAQLTEGTAENRADAFVQWQAWFGEEWPKVFGEFGADVPQETMTLGLLTAPEDEGVRAEYVEAMDTGAKAYKDQLQPDDRRTVEDQTLAEMEDVIATMQARPGGDLQIQGLLNSVELLALKYAADGVDPARAAEQAYDQIIGSKYEFFGTYRVPLEAGVDPDAVTDGALGYQDRIAQYAEGIQTPESLVGLPPDIVQAQAIEDLRRNGYWATNRDETGLALYWSDERPVLLRDGNKLELTWAELMEQGAAAVPPVDTETAAP